MYGPIQRTMKKNYTIIFLVALLCLIAPSYSIAQKSSEKNSSQEKGTQGGACGNPSHDHSKEGGDKKDSSCGNTDKEKDGKEEGGKSGGDKNKEGKENSGKDNESKKEGKMRVIRIRREKRIVERITKVRGAVVEILRMITAKKGAIKRTAVAEIAETQVKIRMGAIMTRKTRMARGVLAEILRMITVKMALIRMAVVVVKEARMMVEPQVVQNRNQHVMATAFHQKSPART